MDTTTDAAVAVDEAIELTQARLEGKVTTTHLLRVVGSTDDARAQGHLATAVSVVGAHLGTPAVVRRVPLDLLAHATTLVASQLWHAQDAPHGVANWADDAGAPVRVARDPLTAARPLLARFVGLGIG